MGGLLSVNHRDVVAFSEASEGHKIKHKFLEMPNEVQDEIIEGLNEHKLSYHAASKLAEKHGISLSYESIRRFHIWLLRERHKYALFNTLSMLNSQFSKMDLPEAIKGLRSLMLASVANAFMVGDIKFQPMNIEDVMRLLPGGVDSEKLAEGEMVEQITVRRKRRVRSEVYGLPLEDPPVEVKALNA